MDQACATDESVIENISNVSIPNEDEISQGRPGWKPEIEHLQDAVDPISGALLVGVGDKILIQYPHRWRDTTIYIVKSINPSHIEEMGYMGLWDPNKMQFTCTNFITGPKKGLLFKIPDNSRRWIPGEADDLATRVKRKYRRSSVEEKPVVVEQTPVVTPQDGVKRGRGRPKGSKNKSTLEREMREREQKCIGRD